MQPNHDADFWDWLVRHEEQLFPLTETEQDGLLDELAAALRAVDPDLTFEFGPVRDGRRELVISADGNYGAFPAVERLFQNRPPLDRFEVIAFRPRRPLTHCVQCGELRLWPHEVFFHLCRDEEPGKLGLLLFLPHYQAESELPFDEAAFLLLDQALGEWDVENRIGFIEMLPCDDPNFAGSRPLTELPVVFDHLIEGV